VLVRTLAVFLLLATLSLPVQAARELTRKDVRTLLNAWFVYPAYGSFQLKNGRYMSASGRMRIALVGGQRFVPIEGSKIAALSTLQTPGTRSILFLSLFTRTNAGYFRDDATVRVGQRVRPLSVTMHASRIRVSVVQPNGRQATHIYHMTGHGLQEAATRHAQ